MRALFFSICFILALCGLSQTYFKDGLKWITKYGSTSTVPFSTGYSAFILYSESDSDSILSMYYYDYEPDAKLLFVSYIKPEGDKIFFKEKSDPDAPWYLLYDFGMTPGDGCYIYSPTIGYPYDVPSHRYLVCKEIIPPSDDCNFERMKMEVYMDDTREWKIDEGYWIKGISSENYPYISHGFHFDGGGSELCYVFDKDSLVYPSKIKIE